MKAVLGLLLLLAACAPGGKEARAKGDFPPDDLNLLPDDNSKIIFADAVGSAGAAPADPPEKPYDGPDFFPESLAQTQVECGFGSAKSLQPVLSDFEERWFTRHLAAAEEAPIREARLEPGAATLRFTWLRSFHAPIVIRVETAGGERRLIAKQLSGAGGYDPGKVERRLERRLAAAEARRLDAALKRNRVFELPPTPCDGGADGAQWIFEHADGSGYRFARRWTPRKGAARELGRHLMELTGWDFGLIY